MYHFTKASAATAHREDMETVLRAIQATAREGKWSVDVPILRDSVIAALIGMEYKVDTDNTKKLTTISWNFEK